MGRQCPCMLAAITYRKSQIRESVPPTRSMVPPTIKAALLWALRTVLRLAIARLLRLRFSGKGDPGSWVHSRIPRTSGQVIDSAIFIPVDLSIPACRRSCRCPRRRGRRLSPIGVRVPSMHTDIGLVCPDQPRRVFNHQQVLGIVCFGGLREVEGAPEDGIVKLMQKTALLCSKQRTIEGFGLSRAPVFSLFPAPQLSSRGRRLRAIFH